MSKLFIKNKINTIFKHILLFNLNNFKLIVQIIFFSLIDL